MKPERDGIIQSFLDTDWYKITMGQVVNRQFPHVNVEYEFINRGRSVFPAGFDQALVTEIENLSDRTITADEIDWLKKNVRYMKPTYLDWLGTYRFNPDEIQIIQEGGHLSVRVRGPWYRTVFWEVPLLAMISELYYRMTQAKPDEKYEQRIVQKMETLQDAGVHWAEFGTRRRFSFDVQNAVVMHMAGVPGFIGTSNPFLAMRFGTKPVGTYAHECVMAMQVPYGFTNCNHQWMEAWVREYGGDLGIALPDTVTTRFFLDQQFGMYHAKLFDGLRQDSGDPDDFAETAIRHYRSLGIDPRSKRVVFSDGLNTERVLALNKRWGEHVMAQFGIGTHLTNDVGHKPLSIVMKMSYADFGWGMVPVVKLSDDKGKYTGCPLRIADAKKELRLG